jgi:hypothetical protein
MTDYPEPVVRVLELAVKHTPEEDVPPELRPALTYCEKLGRVALQAFAPGHPHRRLPRGYTEPPAPNRSTKKARDLRPGDWIEGHLAPVEWARVKPYKVEVARLGLPLLTYPNPDALVVVFDGPRPAPWRGRQLVLLPDGEADLAWSRCGGGKPKVETGDPPAKRRTGRPRKGETDKERLVLAALVAHHNWQPGGSVGNDTPAKTRQLAKLASDKRKRVEVSVATVSRFFRKRFPGRGHKDYEAACVRGEIGALLAKWQGDEPEHLAGLLPRESGRGGDD